MRLRVLVFTAILLACGMRLFAANISIPDLQLITRGYVSGGQFQLDTHGEMKFQVSGGYKFGGNVLLSFEGDNLGDLSSLSNTHLTFQGANLTINNLFSTPLALTYFTGYYDTFASGDAFPKDFGTAPIATHFRGYYYFPNASQYNYYNDGIYRVAGTGIKLSVPHLRKWFDSSLYLYQDANLGSGYYGSDLRALFNFDHFKLEGFVGASFPVAPAGIYRAGALIYYDTGSGGSFLTEIGIPRWNPVTQSLRDSGLFYLLFEPRMDFGSFAIIPTVFWHPDYYDGIATNQVPTANVNVDLRFGNPTINRTIGGFETELDYSSTSSSQFQALVSPYLRLVAAGVIWHFKVDLKLYPFVLADMAEAFVGVQAQL